MRAICGLPLGYTALAGRHVVMRNLIGDEALDVLPILADGAKGVIARDGQVPWQISAALRRFKQLTMGTPLVMGRKTFESLPGLLPGRRHIVLTRDKAWQAEGAEVAHSVEQALKMAGDDDVSIIGGAEIFALFLPFATRIELTEVHEEDTQGDVTMPYPGPEWHEVAREEHPAADGWPPYAFVTLEKRP